MILANELTALDSEIASLQALIEAKRQQQEVLSSAENLASEALARLTQALYKIEEVAPSAICLLKTAVLGLFADGDGGNDDGGNQPTDPTPDTDPTPGADDLEPELIAFNGETGDYLLSDGSTSVEGEGSVPCATCGADLRDEANYPEFVTAAIAGICRSCETQAIEAENSPNATEDNENKSTMEGEAMPYVELVRVSDAIAYQRKHDGEIICTYIGFRTKALAQSWKHFFEAITSSVELRQAKRLENCKWEIKAQGVSIKQIERFTTECDFTKSYQQQTESPAQAAGIEPPSGWGKPQTETPSLPPCPFAEGDIVNWNGSELRVVKIGVEILYCVLPHEPEGTKHHTSVPIAGCSLVESAVQQTEPENLGEGDTCEVLEGRYKGQIGTVASFNRFSEYPISLNLPGGHIKSFLLNEVKLVSKNKTPQSRQDLQTGSVLLGNRVVTTGTYAGLGRRNAINNARNGLEDKLAAMELVKAGVSPEEAMVLVTGNATPAEEYDF